MSIERLSQPQLRLFLSVDVEGSTAFKQKTHVKADEDWRYFFFDFFTRFPEQFQAKLAGLVPDVQQVVPWKVLGDELVYSLLVTDLAKVFPVLDAFRQTLAGYQDAPKHGGSTIKTNRLRLKGAGWLAGFPVGNLMVVMKNANGAETEDFIGPSIDTGFRLSRLSSHRHFTLSVELAWVILNQDERLKLYYSGRKDLKGIMERDGYPHLWMDVFEGMPKTELMTSEDALKWPEAADSDRLKSFCRHYILSHGEPDFLPFVFPHPEDHPERQTYEDKLKSARSVLKSLTSDQMENIEEELTGEDDISRWREF